jgi:hypothetical protein
LLKRWHQAETFLPAKTLDEADEEFFGLRIEGCDHP